MTGMAIRLASSDAISPATKAKAVESGFERIEAMAYTVGTTTVLEIKQAVEKLPREDFDEFRQWLESYELAQDTIAASAVVGAMLDDDDGGASQLIGK